MLNNIKTKRYSSVGDMPKLYPTFTEGMFRSWLHENRCDFRKCVRRMNKKIIIDLDIFEEWISQLDNYSDDITYHDISIYDKIKLEEGKLENLKKIDPNNKGILRIINKITKLENQMKFQKPKSDN